jgi:hypothetical protein
VNRPGWISTGDLDQLGDLVVGEAGQPAEVAGQVDGAVLLLAAEAAEAEDLVDRLLEVEGVLQALLVVGGEPAQPVGAHLHVGDLVGQHPVLAEVQDRVLADLAELAHRVEHVDGQALEGPVDARQAQHGSALQAAS